MHSKTGTLGIKNIDKIYEIISSCKCGFSASEILIKLDKKVNKTTVYRNIEKLLFEEKIIEDFSNS
jgi:Fe2+ or Zn2+ uptake regulation protein